MYVRPHTPTHTGVRSRTCAHLPLLFRPYYYSINIPYEPPLFTIPFLLLKPIFFYSNLRPPPRLSFKSDSSTVYSSELRPFPKLYTVDPVSRRVVSFVRHKRTQRPPLHGLRSSVLGPFNFTSPHSLLYYGLFIQPPSLSVKPKMLFMNHSGTS